MRLDVSGNQVRSELDAGEPCHADHLAKASTSGFWPPGHTLDDVAPGQQSDEHPLDEPVLADDDALDLEDGALEVEPRPPSRSPPGGRVPMPLMRCPDPVTAGARRRPAC